MACFQPPIKGYPFLAFIFTQKQAEEIVVTLGRNKLIPPVWAFLSLYRVTVSKNIHKFL